MTTLTPALRRALALLAEQPQRPSELGSALWGKGHRGPSAHSRAAGALLARLKSAGLADWTSDTTDGLVTWYATDAGERALRESTA